MSDDLRTRVEELEKLKQVHDAQYKAQQDIIQGLSKRMDSVEKDKDYEFERLKAGIATDVYECRQGKYVIVNEQRRL